MNYLQCNQCHQRYELLPDECLEDFNLECGCGGVLVERLDDNTQFMEENDLEYKIEHSSNIQFNIKIGLTLIVTILFGFLILSIQKLIKNIK